MPFFEKPFDEIDADDLRELVGLRERQDLEFKSLYPPGDNYEIAKDISAMANAEGRYMALRARERLPTISDLRFEISNLKSEIRDMGRETEQGGTR
jgi:hypothetical protein